MASFPSSKTSCSTNTSCLLLTANASNALLVILSGTLSVQRNNNNNNNQSTCTRTCRYTLHIMCV